MVDTVNAFILMALHREATVGQVINIGTGRCVSIGEVVVSVLGLLESNAQVVLDHNRVRPEHSEVLSLICDGSKARALLGWEPTYTFEQGLVEVIKFTGSRSRPSRMGVYAI